MGITQPRKGHATPPRVGAALLTLAASAILLLGCGGDSGTDQTSATSGDARGVKAVEIKDYLYKPATITVPRGMTVTFTNRDSTPHTATSKESGVFESGSIDTGKSAEVTLNQSGTFAYYCLFHPFMKGTVIVE
jgi:plastocyanin